MSKKMFDPALVLLEEFYKAIENIPTIHQDGKYKKTQSDNLKMRYNLKVKDKRFVEEAYILYADYKSKSFPMQKQIRASLSNDGVLLKADYCQVEYEESTGEKSFCESDNIKIEGDFTTGIFKYTQNDMTFERHYDADCFSKIKNPLKVVHARRRAKKIGKCLIALGILAAVSAPFVAGVILSNQQKMSPQPAPQHERG